jgi:hypothetical protein
MTAKNSFGQQVLILLNGKELLLRSQGSSPEGDMPLVQTFDVTTKQKRLLWRSQAPYYETVVDVIDAKNGTFLTSRESNIEAPNYYIRNIKKKIAPIAITDFKNLMWAWKESKKKKFPTSVAMVSPDRQLIPAKRL